MNHPHILQQLAFDRQRERLKEADTHRLIKRSSGSRRNVRARRPLYRFARRTFGKTARHALAPVEASSRIADLAADVSDTEPVSAAPSSRQLGFTTMMESHR